jgi:hypothetical protein
MIGEKKPQRPPWKPLEIFRRRVDQVSMVLLQCQRCHSYHAIEGALILGGKNSARCPVCRGRFPIELEE